jgi:hypothetical protein
MLWSFSGDERLAHEYPEAARILAAAPAEVSTTGRLGASFAFGRFSGDFLVGNFGDGQ